MNLVFAVLFISAAFFCYKTNAAVHDVTKYGATGDGTSNDTPVELRSYLAFEKAWARACNSNESVTLVIPDGNTFLTYPVRFQGPCQARNIEIQVLGNVVAPTDNGAWRGCPKWISFGNISNLVVNGTGEFDAQGETWWTGPLKKACQHKPTSLHFDTCNDVSISGIHSKNSPKNHFSIARCNNVSISNIHATAPEDSPNTDGIDISSSTNVRVTDSIIGTGDDCIAINNHCSGIQITNIECGPGHGISVGSLGKHREVVAVENILVQNCTITGTQNGARIKTWGGASGYARSITYRNITLVNVRHPIIINQHYRDKHASLLQNEPGVEISNVTFSGITGTSANKNGIDLNCVTTGPGCTGIVIEDVDITRASGGTPQVNCTNAHGRTLTDVSQLQEQVDRHGHGAFEKQELFALLLGLIPPARITTMKRAPEVIFCGQPVPESYRAQKLCLG
ncbi:unnamed protein product [Rhodiola kirilowii]